MSKNLNQDNILREPAPVYQQRLFDFNISSSPSLDQEENEISSTKSHILPQTIPTTPLKPIIKWAGGKEKELTHILPNLPSRFKNYYEPFVGGGSVFMAVKANHYFINDLSGELISLYRNIATQDGRFFDLLNQINTSWDNSRKFFANHIALVELYLDFRNHTISQDDLKRRISTFCNEHKDEILDILSPDFASEILLPEMNKNLFRKMKRMKELELSKHILPEKDLYDNIETAIKGAVYMSFRHLYNKLSADKIDETKHCALFYFIRNYCYSGMFRYNDKGEFNVPYGGIAYNSKQLAKKTDYYKSARLLKHFASTTIENKDFELFLREYSPGDEDFIFLDPPYDTEFSTYAQNEFNRKDQRRLARYLINDCRARWMLIIKHTDFIFDLYNQPGIKIRSFDKEYIVSFMNRNDRNVTHLLITNY